MKVNPRKTSKRVEAVRITAPETRLDPATDKHIVLLSYIDRKGDQNHDLTTTELFAYAAGRTEFAEPNHGLDRLTHHNFIVHKDETGKAVGLDVLPVRQYRAKVIPKSMENVTTLIVRYDLGGAVARVVQRPFNTDFVTMRTALAELDRLISAGKPIHSGMSLGRIGDVVAEYGTSVEISLRSVPRGGDVADNLPAPAELVEGGIEESTPEVESSEVASA